MTVIIKLIDGRTFIIEEVWKIQKGIKHLELSVKYNYGYRRVTYPINDIDTLTIEEFGYAPK